MIRALILDDDALFTRPLADRLQCESDVPIQAVVAQTLEAAVQIVQGDPRPFDVFLIDERLGAGEDGIAAMEDLMRLQPDAEAIVFTGFDDPEVGYRALQAGALCYLPKTDGLMPELIWRLHWLQGLRMLEEATRQAQRAESLAEVANVIVQSGLRMGFERARLWRVDGAAEASVNGAAGHDGITQTLVGLAADGECAPVEMPKESIPLDRSPYASRALTSPAEVTRFHGEELGPGYLARQKRAEGYRPPVGDWLVAPLCAEGRPVGLLVLDNVTQAREITPEQLRLLRKFCRDASTVLARAWRYERRRQLNEIGARIMTQAAHSNLDKVLKRLRQELGRFTNAHNFIAALVEEEGNRRYLHYRVRYEDGRRQPPVWRSLSEPGLLAHVVERNAPVFAPDAERYRVEHGLQAFGTPARSWMGAPLCVKGRAVGVIALENNRKTNAFTQTEFEQFVEVVEHVQGAIQVARLEEQQEQNSRRLRLLQRASEEMMKLVDEQGEAALWLAALTAATADYGLQFNRAALFLARDGGAKVIGRAGVGHFDLAEARTAWRADRESRMDFDRFLAKLRQGTLEPTPVHRWVCEQMIDLSLQKGHAFQDVLHAGKRTRILADKAARRLPEPFVARFGVHDCALVPLRAGSRVIGLVLVDNAHDGKPICKLALDYLESLLAHAALIYEDHRQRKAHERLNALTCDILSHASRPSLKDTLAEICRVALDVAGVDCASIVPATESGAQVTYDVERAGHAGWQKVLDPVRMPRPDGITEHVLRAGRLVVPDIGKHEARYAGKLIGEHLVLREEGVRALICAPVRAVETGETLGALRLYWRSPQAFGQPELTQAEMFARLAAVAIQNWRAAQQTRAAAEAAEAEAQTRERELAIHRRVMSAALQPDASQEDVVRALLDAARDILNLPQVIVEVNLREWEPSDDPADSEPREIRRKYFLDASGILQCDPEPDPFRGVVGRALRSGQTQLARDVTAPEWRESFYNFHGRATRSQLVAPILRGDKRGQVEAIGALNAESPVVGAFGEAHARALERLAGVAVIALNTRRYLASWREILETSNSTTVLTDADRTLGLIKDIARRVIPDLSVMIVWRVDMTTGEIKLEKCFGVCNTGVHQFEHATEENIVRRALQRRRPIFLTQAKSHPFSRNFASREDIQSCAVLPLQIRDQNVGVILLGYRHTHRFTLEDRALYLVLSNFAAAGVYQIATFERVQSIISAKDLRGAMEGLRRYFSDRKTSICVYKFDPTKEELELTNDSLDFYDFEDVKMTRLLKLNGPSIACRAARKARETGKAEPEYVPDVARDPDFLPGRPGTQSELCMPLMKESRELLGVLILESEKPDAFKRNDIEVVRGVAQQISSQIERSDLSTQLRIHTAIATEYAWASDLAHDFDHAVEYILGRTKRFKHCRSSSHRRWAREIERCVTQLRKTAKKRLGEEPKPIRLDKWLRERIDQIVRRRCRQGDVKVEYRFDPENLPIFVNVNPYRLRRVIRHLVVNALTAMKQQGIIRGEIKVRVQQRSDMQLVRVEIEDSGNGIPPDVYPDLFQKRIKKGDDPLKGGFGLLQVRFDLELMGGQIRQLESEPNRGARFIFTLPASCGYVESGASQS